MTGTAARSIKARLRTGLRDALLRRQAADVRLLRSLIAAIDNAEAPPIGSGAKTESHRFADGSAEIDRLLLDRIEVQAILARELAERQTAAEEMDRVGKPEKAALLRNEATLIRRYLD